MKKSTTKIISSSTAKKATTMDDCKYVDGVTQDLPQRKSDFLLKVANLYVTLITAFVIHPPTMSFMIV